MYSASHDPAAMAARLALRKKLHIHGKCSLAKALFAVSWDVEVDPEFGDIIGIQFAGEKAHEDFKLFKALAPFAKAGSFIAMEGEDGGLWRWWFTGRVVQEQYGRVVYK